MLSRDQSLTSSEFSCYDWRNWLFRVQFPHFAGQALKSAIIFYTSTMLQNLYASSILYQWLLFLK